MAEAKHFLQFNLQLTEISHSGFFICHRRFRRCRQYTEKSLLRGVPDTIGPLLHWLEESHC